MHENPPVEEDHHLNGQSHSTESQINAHEDLEKIKKFIVLPLVTIIALIVLTHLYKTTFPSDLELIKGNPIGIVEMYNNTTQENEQ